MICKLSELPSFWMILDGESMVNQLQIAVRSPDRSAEALSSAQAREADAFQRKLEELQEKVMALGWDDRNPSAINVHAHQCVCVDFSRIFIDVLRIVKIMFLRHCQPAMVT